MNDRNTTHPAVLYTYIGSPIGLLLLAASDAGLHVVDFPDGKHPVRPEPGWQEVDLAMLAEMCSGDAAAGEPLAQEATAASLLHSRTHAESTTSETGSGVGGLTLIEARGGFEHIEANGESTQRNARSSADEITEDARDTERSSPSTTGARLLWKTAQQLDEYFAGQRQQFDLPLAPRGTDFQKQVWRALREIPFGQTWSYAQLAQHIGKPSATRAVGAANGRNPIAIIVPCHRVIGADGGLTGFSGGLSAKSYLLKLEGQLLL